MQTQPEDVLVETLRQFAQDTLGRIATAHPWIAGLCVVLACGGAMLGLVSGLIKPENLGTPRKRAGARLALRFGLAIKGSAADIKTLITGVEPPTPVAAVAADPLAVAAASLPAAPVPTEMVERTRQPYSLPGKAPAEAPAGPVRLPPVVAGARPPSRQPVPREEPRTVPPPAVAPGLRRPGSLARMPTPVSALTETRLDGVAPSRPGSRRRHDSTPAMSVEDAVETPPEVPHSRPRSGQHAEAVRGRDRGRS